MGNTPVPVAVSRDWFFYTPVTLHANVPAPPFIPTAEVPVPMWWPPGRAIGQNKFCLKVLHKTQMITRQGHDCGFLIPHIGPWLPGLAIAICTSSRKFLFSASTVLGESAPLGAICLSPFRPGLVCGAPPIPLPGGAAT